MRRTGQGRRALAARAWKKAWRVPAWLGRVSRRRIVRSERDALVKLGAGLSLSPSKVIGPTLHFLRRMETPHALALGNWAFALGLCIRRTGRCKPTHHRRSLTARQRALVPSRQPQSGPAPRIRSGKWEVVRLARRLSGAWKADPRPVNLDRATRAGAPITRSGPRGLAHPEARAVHTSARKPFKP